VGVFKKYKSENVSNELYGLDHFTYTSKSQFPYFFFFLIFICLFIGGELHMEAREGAKGRETKSQGDSTLSRSPKQGGISQP